MHDRIIKLTRAGGADDTDGSRGDLDIQENLRILGNTRDSVIIDAKTHNIERVKNVGLFPWGTHIMDSKDNYCH